MTATPNTRVLHVRLTAPRAADAQAGVAAAVNAYMNQRQTRLMAERAGQLAVLSTRAEALAGDIVALDRALQIEADRGFKGRSDDRVRVLRDKRSEVVTQSNLVGQQTARVLAGQITAGRQTAETVIKRVNDQARVALVSGVTGGLGLGMVIAALIAARGPRLRRLRDVHGMTGLPLVARAPYAPMGRRTLDAFVRGRPVTYVTVDAHDPVASGMAHLLTDVGGEQDARGGAVVVASERTRVDDVRLAARRLALRGIDVVGVLVATQLRSSRRRPSP